QNRSIRHVLGKRCRQTGCLLSVKSLLAVESPSKNSVLRYRTEVIAGTNNALIPTVGNFVSYVAFVRNTRGNKLVFRLEQMGRSFASPYSFAYRSRLLLLHEPDCCLAP